MVKPVAFSNVGAIVTKLPRQLQPKPGAPTSSVSQASSSPSVYAILSPKLN